MSSQRIPIFRARLCKVFPAVSQAAPGPCGHPGASREEWAGRRTASSHVPGQNLPWKCCSAAPPLSSCKPEPLSWVPDHSWHSPTAHGMPCPVPHPAHAVLCSCFHSSQFPPQAAAHREKRSPLSRVGAGLLAEGLSLPRGASALFKMLHAQRHFYHLLAMDTHSPLGGVSWVKQEEGSLPASCWDGRQPEMLPQPLCMPTTLSSVTHQALPGVALLCTG